jgi:hypothetical protein
MVIETALKMGKDILRPNLQEMDIVMGKAAQAVFNIEG